MATDPRSVPTRLIHTPGPTPVPVEYDVPGSQEIKLASVAAEFDGSGAAGAFECTLALYSQEGNLLSRTVAGDAVAAGASAVATFYPFRRRVAASAGGGGIATFFYVRSNADQFVGAGADAAVLLSVEQIKVGNPFTTVDHKAFTLAAGQWAIGYQALTDYVDSGTAARLIAIMENPVTTGQVASANVSNPAAAGTEYLQSIGTTFLWDSATQGPKIQMRFYNLSGDTVTISGGGFTYMWGALLKAA